MRLVELEPAFLVIEEPGRRYRYVDALEHAQGIQLLCPACFVANGGAIGTHGVWCWFRDRGVPQAEAPGPARWAVEGTGLEDLTLSPSVLLLGGCGWHGWITDGQVTMC